MEVDDFVLELESGKKAICIVGLGYVGLPLAAEMSKFFKVIGYDKDQRRVRKLKAGFEVSGEVDGFSDVNFTDDPGSISSASLIIVAVPTPVYDSKVPNLEFIKEASETVGRHMVRGSIVVYESTVYPGVTRKFCVPILEKESGLKCGKDFKIGYSPERANPGDKEHTLKNVVKIVAGQDEHTCGILARVYSKVVEAGIYKAPSIEIAEAAKVIENVQRDLNIALMNELSIIFHKMGLDSSEIFKAAATKWNFLKFEPGLVGGHCIPVDPYYLTYCAQALDYHPEVILAGRKINDYMGKYVAEEVIKLLVSLGKSCPRVLIMGITFKENVKDVRNSKVVDIVKDLKDWGAKVFVYDPLAIPEDVRKLYRIKLSGLSEGKPYDAIVVAVKHESFLRISLKELKKLCSEKPVLADVKGIFKKHEAEKLGLIYWRL